MRRSLRRHAGPLRGNYSIHFLSLLLLLLLLSAGGSAQTIRHGPTARTHRVHRPDFTDNENVEFSSGDWSQLGRLQRYKYDVYCCSQFGSSVGISGDTIVVGDNEYRLTVGGYIFVRPISGWQNLLPTAQLLAPLAGPYFTTSCFAIDGDTVVAGTGSGVVYVYVKPEGGWTDMYPTAILSTGGVDFTFGLSVSISGDTIVVGDEGNNAFTGAVYVFVKPESGWHEMAPTATLSASDGQPTDSFGAAVSINGKTIAVGATQYNAPGKAYVFVKPPAGWTYMTQTAELRATDAPNGAYVGYSISTSNDNVLVGSRGRYDPVGAYMFVKPKGGWSDMTETAKLSAADPRIYSSFGNSVLVSGKTAVVGAPNRSRRSFWDTGAAYVFTEPSGGWRDMSSNIMLTGSDARYEAEFGTAVSMTGNLLVVGAAGFGFHTAYVFGHP